MDYQVNKKLFFKLYLHLLQLRFFISLLRPHLKPAFIVPFYKDLLISMSPFLFIFLGSFVVVGSSNAVNLTDGLDGLAILPTILIAGALGLIAYGMGNILIADYLYLPHLRYLEN
jgi:phospho-N-acetylmuramoyl-pentapeptide-transferase